MPVHWYYNPADIVRQFGAIRGYEAPPERHPSSIMSLANTGGSGRGGQQGKIIGARAQAAQGQHSPLTLTRQPQQPRFLC